MHLRHECVYTRIKLYTYSGPEKISWSIHSFCNEKNGFRTKTHKPQRQSWNIWTKPGGWALENHQADAIVFHQLQEPANYLIFQNLSKPSLGNIGYWIHLDTDFCQGDHKGPLKRCRRHFPPGRSLSCRNRRHQARLLFHPKSRGKVHQWPWAGPEWLQNMEWSNVKQEKFRVLKVILCNYCLCTYLYLIIAPVRLSEVKLREVDMDGLQTWVVSAHLQHGFKFQLASGSWHNMLHGKVMNLTCMCSSRFHKCVYCQTWNQRGSGWPFLFQGTRSQVKSASFPWSFSTTGRDSRTGHFLINGDGTLAWNVSRFCNYSNQSSDVWWHLLGLVSKVPKVS